MHINESWKWLVRLIIGICLLAFLATTTWQLLISLCIPLVGMGIIAFGGWLLRKSNNASNNGL